MDNHKSHSTENHVEMRGVKLTYENINERLKIIHDGNVSIDFSTYTNARKKAKFVDCKYGEWWAQPGNVLNGQGHKQRFHDNMRMSLEAVKLRLSQKHGDIITIVDETWISPGKKCKFIDSEFGEFEAQANNVLNGSTHPKRGLAKRKATWITKYGVDNPFKSEWIQLKASTQISDVTRIKHWQTDALLVCRGSYEVAFVNWCNENQISFDWQISHIMPDGCRYIIDAFIKTGQFANTWVEIKGWMRPDAKLKWEWFQTKYENSQLWDKQRLTELKILPGKSR